MSKYNNLIKKLLYIFIAICVFLTLYYIYKNFVTRGKVVIKSQDSNLVLKNIDNKKDITAHNKISARLSPGQYVIISDNNNAKTYKNLEVKARKTINYNPTFQPQTESQAVFKTDTPNLSAGDDELKLISNDKFLATVTNQSINKYMPNIKNIYLTDTNIGYIVDNNNLVYYYNLNTINQVNLPKELSQTFKINYSKDGNFFIWDNHNIYKLKETSTSLMTNTVDTIEDLSVYNNGLYYSCKSKKDNGIQTIIKNASFDNTTISTINFWDDAKTTQNGESNQDKPPTIVHLYSSPDGNNIIIEKSNISYIYNKDLKQIDTLPIKNISVANWKTNSKVYYSEADSLFLYSTDTKESSKILQSKYNYNISNIYLSDNKTYFSTGNGSKQIIYKTDSKQNEDASIAINNYPISFNDCTINFVNINYNNLILNTYDGSNKASCYVKAKESIALNGINENNIKIDNK